MNLRIVAACASMAALAPSASLAQSAVEQGPESAVVFRNELPRSYRLTHVILVVDGAVVYDGPGFGTAHIPPGAHVVEISAEYRMHSSVLTYMQGYTVEVRSAHVIRPHPFGPNRVVAHAVRHGGATTPLERSAAIAWTDLP